MCFLKLALTLHIVEQGAVEKTPVGHIVPKVAGTDEM